MSTFTGTGPIMAGPAEASLGQRWGWLLALGIVQIIAGSIAITVPLIASLIAVGIFGALLIMTGIMQLVHADLLLRQYPRFVAAALQAALNGFDQHIVLAKHRPVDAPAEIAAGLQAPIEVFRKSG